jgi:hypothetical protein
MNSVSSHIKVELKSSQLNQKKNYIKIKKFVKKISKKILNHSIFLKKDFSNLNFKFYMKLKIKLIYSKYFIEI